MSSDRDEQEVDSWLVDATEEDDDDAASVDSNPRPPGRQWTPSLPSYLLDLQKEEENQTLEIEWDTPILHNGAGEFRTADLRGYENPSFSDAFSDKAEDLEENIADIFRVWEIKTDPELEKGTLTEIFTSSLEDRPSDDGNRDFSGSQTSVDALDLKDLESVESVIAAMGDLSISVPDDDRNG